MKKRLIASNVIAFGALIGLTGCGITPGTHAAQQSSITETGQQVAIDVQIGTKANGVAEVTLVGPPTSQYPINDFSYALPVQKGRVQGTVTNPWSGKTDVDVMVNSKTVATATVNGTGAALSDQQLDLLPSYLMDYNIASVSNQAHVIESRVHATKTARNQAVASATLQWVKTHIHSSAQTQTERADQTLQSASGNQTSATALAVALLRADNIPAKDVQTQVTQDGMYGTSYSVSAWLNDKWTSVGTP